MTGSAVSAVERLSADAVVLVITGGDDAWLDVGGRTAWPFPRASDGSHLAVTPVDDYEAIAMVEDLRREGATALVVPAPSSWWLERYPQLAQHLESCYQLLSRDGDGAVYALLEPEHRPPHHWNEWTLDPEPILVRHGLVTADELRRWDGVGDGLRVSVAPSSAGSAWAEAACAVLPAGSTVLVAGADAPTLPGRTARALDLGSDPVAQVKASDAAFLVVPPDARSALASAQDLTAHLEAHAPSLRQDETLGTLFALRDVAPDGLPLPSPALIHLVTWQYTGEFFYWHGVLGSLCIRGLLAKHGLRLDRFGAILDFGCGCGRLMRQWKDLRGPRLVGTDYNGHLVDWCRRSLPFAEFTTNRAAPPLDFEDETFDFLYGFSVFTHLEAEQQAAWLDELNRVLRPGGYALLTTHGLTRLSLITPVDKARFLSGEMVIVRRGTSGSNSCATFHPESYIRREWSRVFDVVDVATGWARDVDQDAVLLRKRDAK